MKKVNLLSRAEMKKVLGGNGEGTGEIGGNTELKCTTPGGTEYWRRACTQYNALSECNAIYPLHVGHITAECALILIP